MEPIDKAKISKVLALYIKQKRKAKKMTQEQLCFKAELSYKQIQKLESEKAVKDAQLSTLLKLARGLDVKPMEIFKAIV